MSDKYQNGKMYTIRYKNDDSISMYVYIRMYVYTYIRMYVGMCVYSISYHDDSHPLIATPNSSHPILEGGGGVG